MGGSKRKIWVQRPIAVPGTSEPATWSCSSKIGKAVRDKVGQKRKGVGGVKKKFTKGKNGKERSNATKSLYKKSALGSIRKAGPTFSCGDLARGGRDIASET